MISFLFSRSLENPSTPLSDPDEWLYEALGSRQSDSGIRVNRRTAHTYAAYWRGKTLLTTYFAKVPTLVYRRDGDKGKVRDRAHPAYTLLRFKPSPLARFEAANAFVFKQTLLGHALDYGNGFAWIRRDGAGRPIELLLLDPEATTAVRENGRLLYKTELPDERGRLDWFTVLPENVFHLRGLGFDGLSGYSLIEHAGNSLGLGLAARKYGSVLFKNSARPSVVVEVPTKLSDKAFARMEKSWGRHTGLDDQHRVKILEQGATINPFGHSARDAQLVELRRFEIREVANWLGLPPHKLGDDAKSSFSSLEQENQSLLDDSLDGWFCAFEVEAWDKLLSEKEKRNDTHVIEFLRQALVRADIAKRSAFYRGALGGAPFMTIDEVRSLENMNPIGEDDLLKPLNMNSGGVRSNVGGRASDGEYATRNPQSAILQRDLSRMIGRLAAQAQKAAKDSRTFPEFLAGLPAAHRDVIRKALQPAAELCGRDAAELTDSLLQRVACSLQEVYDTATPPKFAQRVSQRCAQLRDTLPAELTG